MSLMLLLSIAETVARLSVLDSMTSTPNDRNFSAGYAVQASGVWAVEFYHQGYPDRRWIARRSLIIPSGREQVTWISEADCPAVRGVVETLNQFSIGSIRVPDLRPRVGPTIIFQQPKGPPTEAARYFLWGSGIQADGSFADYKVSATAGMLADWGKMAEASLESCWTNGS